MKLRLPALLKERGLDVPGLVKLAEEKGFPLSRMTAYRLARDDWQFISRENIDILSAVLGVDPGALFEWGDPPPVVRHNRPGRPTKELETEPAA